MANSRGPEGKASMTVEGKMFGLTFHEQWYVLGKGDGFRVASYIGDTQQGPYEGAFVFTETKDALSGGDGAKKRYQVDAILAASGLDPKKMAPIDNTCPVRAQIDPCPVRHVAMCSHERRRLPRVVLRCVRRGMPPALAGRRDDCGRFGGGGFEGEARLEGRV